MLGYGEIPTDGVKLDLTLKGIRRASARRRPQREPVTTSIMCRLLEVLSRGLHTPFTDIMLQAAMCVAFFGGLRISELLACKVGHVSFSFDVDLGLKFLTLFLPKSKTDLSHRGVTLKLFSTGNNLCAVNAMSSYINVLLVKSPEAFLFYTADGKPLNRMSFLHLLRETLVAAGCDATNFNTHSFRKGMATSLSAAGVSDHVISTMGRWKSQCYKLYISTPASVISQSQASISNPMVAKV